MEWKLNFRDDGILEIISRGRYSIEDLKIKIEQLISDPRWKPGMNTIADFREMDVNITLKDIYSTRKVHALYDNKLGEGKVAMILKTDLAFGIGRSYESISEGLVKARIKIFRNYEEGLEWIQGEEI